MKSVKKIILIIVISYSPLFGQINKQIAENNSAKYTGFRASRILSSYPDRKFPEPDYWQMVGEKMARNFDGFAPAGLFVVSIYLSNPEGYCLLSFPKPNEGIYDSILFSSKDQNEKYLNHFDSTGVKVWLQVEPGGGDIDTLISLVLNRYKHHKSVVGFGIDVEWYQTQDNPGGRKVNDGEVENWESIVKSIDSTYTLFLKHYSTRWMPPNYRGEIIFVDDSQDFNWYHYPFQGMITEFSKWGREFYPNPVAFQYGYPLDENWWREFDNPPKVIGEKLLENIPNTNGLYWVDFTVIDVFPPTTVEYENKIPNKPSLSQNYPNPFNPTTKIMFSLQRSEEVTLKVFDLTGKELAVLINDYKSAGSYELNFNANFNNSRLASGIYIYELRTSTFSLAKKMTLIK